MPTQGLCFAKLLYKKNANFLRHISYLVSFHRVPLLLPAITKIYSNEGRAGSRREEKPDRLENHISSISSSSAPAVAFFFPFVSRVSRLQHHNHQHQVTSTEATFPNTRQRKRIKGKERETITHPKVSGLAPDIAIAWRPVSECSKNSRNFSLKISRPCDDAALAMRIMGPQRLSVYVTYATTALRIRKMK